MSRYGRPAISMYDLYIFTFIKSYPTKHELKIGGLYLTLVSARLKLKLSGEGQKNRRKQNISINLSTLYENFSVSFSIKF